MGAQRVGCHAMVLVQSFLSVHNVLSLSIVGWRGMGDAELAYCRSVHEDEPARSDIVLDCAFRLAHTDRPCTVECMTGTSKDYVRGCTRRLDQKKRRRV